MEAGNQNYTQLAPVNSIPYMFPVFGMEGLPFLGVGFNSEQPMGLEPCTPPAEERESREQMDQHLLYFKSFFSSMGTAQSLQKRNENFEMIRF